MTTFRKNKYIDLMKLGIDYRQVQIAISEPYELYQAALGVSISYWCYFCKMSYRMGGYTDNEIAEINLN